MDTELNLLAARVAKLEKQLSVTAQQPELKNVRVDAIIDEVGTLLMEKAWNNSNKKESIRASFEISTHFNNHWPDKNNHSDLQYLVNSVGKNMGIDYMPSYTAIQDWIRAFSTVQLSYVYLIGKSAAIILAKKCASQPLIDYVISAAENNDTFSIEKIKELIQREKQSSIPQSQKTPPSKSL